MRARIYKKIASYSNLLATNYCNNLQNPEIAYLRQFHIHLFTFSCYLPGSRQPVQLL